MVAPHPLSPKAPKKRAATEGAVAGSEKPEMSDSEQLVQQALFLRSVVPFPPGEQSKGKSPKFRGSDAMDILLNQDLVESEEEAAKTLAGMEDMGLLESSKGTAKQGTPTAARKKRWAHIRRHVL